MPKLSATQSDWWSEMRRQFADASFQEAGQTYDVAVDRGATPSAQAQILRARILLKHDENSAVAFLIDHQPKAASAETSGQWSLLLATGYARMRDFERADHYFDRASTLLTRASDKAAIFYHRARRMLLEGRLDEAAHFAAAMRCDRSTATAIDQELLRSFIFSHQERYLDEAGSLIKALEIIGQRVDEFREPWFHAVQNLALLARELSSEAALRTAKTQVDRDVEWPKDFAAQRFQALKGIGWALGLRGDALGCFRYLRMAEQIAPSNAFTVTVLLDRAFFARIIGERTWADDQISAAEAIADREDWNRLPGEERAALLLLAEAFAESNHEKARYYFARYKGLDKIRSPLHLFAFDHRLEAFADYVEGVLRLSAGDIGAETPLRNAWVIFDRIAYDWRAGRTALRLHEASHKERWLHLAEDKLEHYPHSWLAQELRLARGGMSYNVELTPMQQKVFDMLSNQMTTSKIAKRLGLSPYTVRNHLKAIFKAYGVKNQAALIAEAARRGQLPSPMANPNGKAFNRTTVRRRRSRTA